MNAEKLTEYLGVNPTRFQNKGEKSKSSLNSEIEINGWFLSSKENIKSKDCRRHIDYLTHLLIPIKSKLENIIIDGGKIDVSCYWKSKNGHGGPTLSTEQFRKLSELEIELWFDIY
jgi:hypothetical protein